MNKLNDAAKTYLGQKLSPTYGPLGCVEALRFIFKQATSEELVNSYSTKTLYLSLKKDIRFVEVKKPEVGNLIVSPTGYGNGSFPGHCGIVGENEEIYSNNSDTFLWDIHYTISSWHERYMRKGGFPVLFFRLLENEPVKPETPLQPQNSAKNNAIIDQLKVVLEKITTILQKLLK